MIKQKQMKTWDNFKKEAKETSKMLKPLGLTLSIVSA